ncbi:hypothetical protein ENBRE01_1815 [Enteropsectra breve]|nr:hypothetical protein ENBRE01_1815 [Enteropsectra breve]
MEYAKQYFANLLSNEMYSSGTLENLIKSIYSPNMNLQKNEFDNVKSIHTLEAMDVYIHTGVRVLMESRNISHVHKILSMYEKQINIFKLQNTATEKNKQENKMSLLSAKKIHQVQYLNSSTCCIVRITQLAREHIAGAKYFVRFFRDSFLNVFICNELLGDNGIMYVSTNSELSSGHLLFGVQSYKSSVEINNAISGFLQECKETVSSHEHITSLITLDPKIAGTEINGIIALLDSFITHILQKDDHCYVVSDASLSVTAFD